MELTKVNHVITAVMQMLTVLREAGTINYDQVNVLLPVILEIVFKNSTIETGAE